MSHSFVVEACHHRVFCGELKPNSLLFFMVIRLTSDCGEGISCSFADVEEDEDVDDRELVAVEVRSLWARMSSRLTSASEDV